MELDEKKDALKRSFQQEGGRIKFRSLFSIYEDKILEMKSDGFYGPQIQAYIENDLGVTFDKRNFATGLSRYFGKSSETDKPKVQPHPTESTAPTGTEQPKERVVPEVAQPKNKREKLKLNFDDDEEVGQFFPELKKKNK